jgi:hypothetical protein
MSTVVFSCLPLFRHRRGWDGHLIGSDDRAEDQVLGESDTILPLTSKIWAMIPFRDSRRPR